MSALVIAVAPALPLHSAGKYVAGAYIVFVALMLIYVAIMARRLQRGPSASSASCARPGAGRRCRGRASESEPRAGAGRVSELLAIGVSHKTAPVEVRERLALPDASGRPSSCATCAAPPTSTRRWRSRPATGPSSTWSSAIRSRPRAGCWRCSPAQAGIRPTGLAVGDLLASQLRRRAPPLPGHGRARVDGRRRGRDPGPGQARLRRARSAKETAGPLTNHLFKAALADRQARAHRDRDRRAPAQPARPSPSALARELLGSARRPRGRDHRHRRDERAGRPRARRQRRAAPCSSPTAGATGRSGSPALRRAQRQLRRAPAGPEPRRHRRRRHGLAASAARSPGAGRGDGRPATRRPMLLIDLAVPRDIDAACGELEGVSLYDIDDLQAVIDRNRKVRQAEARKAEGIIEEEIQHFAAWLGSLEVMPTLAALRAHATEIAEQVVRENDGKWETASPRDLERVDALARAVVNRLLHEPTLRLKELRDDRVHARTALVRDLFGLGERGGGARGGRGTARESSPRSGRSRNAVAADADRHARERARARAGAVGRGDAGRGLRARDGHHLGRPRPGDRGQVAVGLGARARAARGPDRPRRPLGQGRAGRARRRARAGGDHRPCGPARRDLRSSGAGFVTARGRGSGRAACGATRRSGPRATTSRW